MSSTNLEPLRNTLDRIHQILADMRNLRNEPENARKALETAVIGHKNWDGYDVRPVGGKGLHDRALAAVTNYLIEDLIERNRARLKKLADELDQLRHTLANQATELRFNLIDDVLTARNW